MTDCPRCCVEYDPCDASSQTVRTARKPYRCDECGEEIRPGEQYERAWTLIDGKSRTHRTCSPCLGIRRDCFPCGWAFGRLREDFMECNGYDYVDGRSTKQDAAREAEEGK